MPRHLALAMAAVLVALIPASIARADRYDTPIVSVYQVSRASVMIEVTAGATGLPAGFGIDWMSRDVYDATGGWDGGALYYCLFSGTPTYNVWPGALTYRLGPFETARIEVGDLNDETGVETDYDVELDAGVRYVFRGYAAGDINGEESYYTSTLQATTTEFTGEETCIRTIGYWKNHAGAWPVTTLMLGTVSYNQAQLLQILNYSSLGNGLNTLAKQLIATKLNIANGGDPGPIASHVAAADALIGSLVPPSVGTDFLSPSVTNATKDMLDAYNNGIIEADCGVVRSTLDTWGGVKSRYRR